MKRIAPNHIGLGQSRPQTVNCDQMHTLESLAVFAHLCKQNPFKVCLELLYVNSVF